MNNPLWEPVFLHLGSDRDAVGIAVGVRHRCRLTSRPRHYLFPTVPALAGGLDTGAALDALVKTLRAADAAEIIMESYDARWTGGGTIEPDAVSARDEYVLPLVAGPAMMKNLSSGHRRQVRRGDRSGWRVRCSAGEEARALLTSVQEAAAGRAAARRQGFTLRVPPFEGREAPGVNAWGSTVFGAWAESALLAAALVGWANGRAFYIMGGSTAAGYECGASAWLHWRIATQLAACGFQTYNLGGTPPEARSPDHPEHGLYRFKTGFGACVVPCCSMKWILGATHERMHRFARWLGQFRSTDAPAT